MALLKPSNSGLGSCAGGRCTTRRGKSLGFNSKHPSRRCIRRFSLPRASTYHQRGQSSLSVLEMFSPDASVANALSASQRNPRRRRRNESDTGTQRQPRKRSRIAQDQFEPVANGKAVPNGHATNGHTSALNHIPVREKRLPSSGYRPAKSDASTVLVSASSYL